MERYTPQAKEALSLAVGMAESLNHGYVGTEHLLIGLLQEGISQPADLPKYFCTDGRKCSLYPKSPQGNRKQL